MSPDEEPEDKQLVLFDSAYLQELNIPDRLFSIHGASVGPLFPVTEISTKVRSHDGRIVWTQGYDPEGKEVQKKLTAQLAKALMLILNLAIREKALAVENKIITKLKSSIGFERGLLHFGIYGKTIEEAGSTGVTRLNKLINDLKDCHLGLVIQTEVQDGKDKGETIEGVRSVTPFAVAISKIRKGTQSRYVYHFTFTDQFIEYLNASGIILVNFIGLQKAQSDLAAAMAFFLPSRVNLRSEFNPYCIRCADLLEELNHPTAGGPRSRVLRAFLRPDANHDVCAELDGMLLVNGRKMRVELDYDLKNDPILLAWEVGRTTAGGTGENDAIYNEWTQAGGDPQILYTLLNKQTDLSAAILEGMDKCGVASSFVPLYRQLVALLGEAAVLHGLQHIKAAKKTNRGGWLWSACFKPSILSLAARNQLARPGITPPKEEQQSYSKRRSGPK